MKIKRSLVESIFLCNGNQFDSSRKNNLQIVCISYIPVSILTGQILPGTVLLNFFFKFKDLFRLLCDIKYHIITLAVFKYIIAEFRYSKL